MVRVLNSSGNSIVKSLNGLWCPDTFHHTVLSNAIFTNNPFTYILIINS